MAGDQHNRNNVHSMKLHDIVELDEKNLEKLYSWVDDIPLSRPKKNLSRDFSDGVLAAEIAHNQIPKIVDMHNYTATSSVENKITNWNLLNRKVLRHLEFEVDPNVIRNIVHCRPWTIENFLVILREKLDSYLMMRNTSRYAHAEMDEAPEADQQVSPRSNPGYVPGTHRSPLTHKRTNRAQVVPAKQYLSPRNKAGQEMVPKVLLLKKQDELSSKEETIQILGAKITGLEKLITLKDIRIDDLTTRISEIENFRPPAHGMRKAHSHQRLTNAGLRGGRGGGARGGGAYYNR